MFMKTSRTVQEEQLRELRLMNAQLNPGAFLLKVLFWPAVAFMGLYSLCLLAAVIAQPFTQPSSKAGLLRPVSHSISTHPVRKEIK
jgi:hypothetical protein